MSKQEGKSHKDCTGNSDDTGEKKRTSSMHATTVPERIMLTSAKLCEFSQAGQQETADGPRVSACRPLIFALFSAALLDV